ncbi:MAG: DUF2796 domain-containing protein [Rhodospirillaceae bacterium]
MTLSAVLLARRSALMLAVAAIMALSPGVSATEKREHGAHVHGLGHLNIAIEGDRVEIELEAPGADIVGFEHAPKEPAERAAVAKAIEKLKDGAGLFVFPDPAGCRLAMSEARSTAGYRDAKEHGGTAGHGHGHGHSHAHGDGKKEEHAEAHSEFRAHYRFACERGDALTGMEVRLFEVFPAAREFAVQAVTAGGQTSGELTREAPRLKF